MSPQLAEKSAAMQNWLDALPVAAHGLTGDVIDAEYCRAYVDAVEEQISTAIGNLASTAGVYAKFLELQAMMRDGMVLLTRIAAIRYGEGQEILDEAKRLSRMQRDLAATWPLPDDKLIERSIAELDQGQGIPIEKILHGL